MNISSNTTTPAVVVALRHFPVERRVEAREVAKGAGRGDWALEALHAIANNTHNRQREGKQIRYIGMEKAKGML